ncbi:MAG TPA: MTH938/NDUFAF3 family protein, partial [Syntrophobacteria bacterium]|nr:MTH938/NDUFAF3 family protein [Syntrophobacteria bacterium]
GAMTVRGEVHRSDLKIIGDKVIGNWWRIEGHAVHEADIVDVLGASVEILVVGSGEPGRMEVTRAAAQALERRGIELVALPTRQAVGVFNSLRSQGKRVAGAFHLTC